MVYLSKHLPHFHVSLQQNGSVYGLQNICHYIYNVHLCSTYTKYDYKHIFSFHSLKKQGNYNLLHVLSLNYLKHWYHVTVRAILYRLLQSPAHNSHYNDEFVGTLDAPLFKTKSHQQYERKRDREPLLPSDFNSHKNTIKVTKMSLDHDILIIWLCYNLTNIWMATFMF